MTELATRDEHALAVVDFDQPAPARRTADLVAWADEARAAHTIAESLARTSFVPKQFQGKPAECTAAILTGVEMGLSPMASLRAFDLIQGTPAMRANAMRGVVQSRGHQVWVESMSATKVVVLGRRLGEEHVHRSEWTIERARGLGLLVKDNWKKQPQTMLVARATSEVCRLTASDVLHGVPYSVEELGDQGDEPAPAKRKARRRTQDAPPPTEPAFPEPERGADEQPASGPAEPAFPEPDEQGGES